MTNPKKAYFLAFLAVLAWSTAASAFKITLKYINFYQLLFIATLSSFVILLFLSYKKLYLLKNWHKQDFLNSVFLGFLNPFLYYIVLLKAYTLLPAQLAQPLNFIWPVMIVLLSVPILKQKISGRSFFAIIISFVGVIIISAKGNFTTFRVDSPLGVFLALFSSVSWALYWIFNQKNKQNVVLKLMVNFAFAVVIVFAYLVVTGNFVISNLDIRGVLGAIYVGFFEMGITFVIWLKAMKLSKNTTSINNFVYLTPFISLIFISILIKEKILLSTLVGLVFIIAGIVLQKKFGKEVGEKNAQIN
jgi:drug/metabolite transporter (DMT)-like permease